MKCPRCGKELRRSKKDPSYGLCDNCRKKYRWVEESDFDDYEEDTEFSAPAHRTRSSESRSRKKAAVNSKQKHGCLTGIVSILVIIIALFAFISMLTGGDDSDKDSKSKTEASPESSTPKESSENDAPEDDVPTEYKSALLKAQDYSDVMYMSKQGIYDQLVSEYGEKFSAEAAQYAIENLDADYKANALKKAKDYQETMNMSPEAIRDQLVSENGEKFTQEEADYAIDNLE